MNLKKRTPSTILCFIRKKIKQKEVSLKDDEFDFTLFEKKFPILKEDQSSDYLISTVYILYIQKLLQEGRIGNAVNYQDSYNSLKKFKGNVRFIDIY